MNKFYVFVNKKLENFIFLVQLILSVSSNISLAILMKNTLKLK